MADRLIGCTCEKSARAHRDDCPVMVECRKISAEVERVMHGTSVAGTAETILCPVCGHWDEQHHALGCVAEGCPCSLSLANVYYRALAEKTAECERLTKWNTMLAETEKQGTAALRASLATAQEEAERLRRENALLLAGAPVPLPAPTTIAAGTCYTPPPSIFAARPPLRRGRTMADTGKTTVTAAPEGKYTVTGKATYNPDSSLAYITGAFSTKTTDFAPPPMPNPVPSLAVQPTSVEEAELCWATARGFDLKAPHWDDLDPDMRDTVRRAVELAALRAAGVR